MNLGNPGVPLVLGVVTSFLVVTLLACAQTPDGSRPRRITPQNSKSVPVKSSRELQAAINAAKLGDTIVLQAGVSYPVPTGQESFTFPDKGPGSEYITIRTSALDTLPGEGVRVSRKDAPSMPKIVATKSAAALFFPERSHHWRFVGIAVTNSGSQFVNDLAESAFYNAFPTQPHHIEFDRCLMYPQELEGVDLNPTPDHRNTVARAIFINGSEITVKNSYLYGFGGFYPGSAELTVSECVLTDVGVGPYYIVNNYLEAWYAQIFIGGADPDSANNAKIGPGATLTSARFSQVPNLNPGDLVAIEQTVGEHRTMATGKVTGVNGNLVTFTPLKLTPGTFATTPPPVGANARWNGIVPSNIEIRGNTFYKRPEWKTWNMGNPKGVFEIKNGINITVEGNIFDGVGGVMAFTARNQGSAAPWSRFENIIIRNNLVKEFGPIFVTFLDDLRVNQNGHTVRIYNNLFFNTSDPPDSMQMFFKLNDGADVQVYNNTVLQWGNVLVTDCHRNTHQTTDFVFRDNIIRYGHYGYQCLEGLTGASTDCWPGWVNRNNVVIDDNDKGPLDGYFPGNFFPPSVAAVGFVDPARGNYRLGPKSRFRGRGSDGRDPGVDMDKLEAALANTGAAAK